MSQNLVDFSIDPSGVQLLDGLLTDLQQNILTNNSGTVRPAYAVAGTSWIDITSNPWNLYYYDGSNDVKIGEINTSTHLFTPLLGVVTASEYQIAGKKAVNGPAFSAYASAAQSYTGSTYVKLQANTDVFDTDSAYDSSTNYRFTPQVEGYYQVSGGINFTVGGVAIIMDLYKNGAAHKRLCFLPSAQSAYGTTLVYMNGSTDYLELFAAQFGATQNTSPSALSTYFMAAMVRGA